MYSRELAVCKVSLGGGGCGHDEEMTAWEQWKRKESKDTSSPGKGEGKKNETRERI